MRRGEIWWATMSDPAGSEPGYRRPVLVVQADGFNRSRIATVIVAAITSNLQLAAAPGNVALSKRGSKLHRQSVVNLSQIMTLNKARLTERVAGLPTAEMAEVEAGLRLVLSL